MPAQDALRKKTYEISRDLTRDIKKKWPEFELNFIVFRRGQFQDECQRTMTALSGHPCQKSAVDLLHNKNTAPEMSAFIGMASGVEKSFLGLARKNFYVGFVSLNADLYKNETELLFDLYHMTSQAFDTFQAASKLKQSDAKSIALQPKRNQLALSRSNLRSDIFSALMMLVNGHQNAVQDLARYRAEKSLTPQTFYRPEDYPFVISTDVMDYSIKNAVSNNRPKDVLSLFTLSNRIATSFDKHNLRSWINFSGPAQTMAWNGYTPEQILGSAIYSSTDPFIKSTANLLCEITQIIPEQKNFPANASNPYVDERINQINHARLAEETFELAIVRAVETESHLPLIKIANDQNQELLKGRMLGWCANALQSTANTFEQMMKKGLPPAPASRIEFQRLASQMNWENLDTLNTYTIAQRRGGHAMTFSDIANWSSNRPELKAISDSIEMTLHDPSYARELAMANEVPVPLVRPVAAPQVQPQAAPSMHRAPAAMPGMAGGGMMGGGITVQRPQNQSAPLQTEDDQ